MSTWETVEDVLDEVREQLQTRGARSAQKLREAFQMADIDGSGDLGPLEFDECLNHVGVFLGTPQLSMLIRAVDKSGDKRVQYREFMEAFLRPLEGRRMSVVRKAWDTVAAGARVVTFEALERAYSGATVPEVRAGRLDEESARVGFFDRFATLTGLGPGSNVDEGAFFDFYTDFSNGVLDDDEFAAQVGGSWAVREHQEDEEEEELQRVLGHVFDRLMAKNDGVEQPYKTLRRAFKFFDTDESGAITEDEFGAGMERMGVQLRPEQRAAFFQRFDRDGSGRISVDEFARVVAPVQRDTYDCLAALGTHKPRLLPGASF